MYLHLASLVVPLVIGVIFTFFSDRATHLEIVNTLETGTFVVALIKLIGRRRNTQQMHSGNANEFVNAIRELIKSFQGINHKRI